MISDLRKMVTGLDIRQEYVCLALEEFRDPFSVSVTSAKSNAWLDVTHSHLFLGYKPLIIGLIFGSRQEEFVHEPYLCLSFQRGSFVVDSQWNGFPTTRHGVARLILRRVNELRLDEHHVVFFQGECGEHSLLPVRNQWANNLRSYFKRKEVGNVGLPGNLYDQVRIAYSLPRPICLVTLGSENQMNLFPTDLHGAIGGNYYISSLRGGGKACSQVEQLKKIVLSTIDSLVYKTAYQLGKNHMKDLAAKECFDLYHKKSAVFATPLPAMVCRYRELEWTSFFDLGIHRIFIYQVVNEETVSTATSLAHIHCYYAQWRMNNGLLTEYLFR